jgi:hypothetical protein
MRHPVPRESTELRQAQVGLAWACSRHLPLVDASRIQKDELARQGVCLDLRPSSALLNDLPAQNDPRHLSEVPIPVWTAGSPVRLDEG